MSHLRWRWPPLGPDHLTDGSGPGGQVPLIDPRLLGIRRRRDASGQPLRPERSSLGGVVGAAESLGLAAYRVAFDNYSGDVAVHIKEAILRSRVVVADLTRQRPTWLSNAHATFDAAAFAAYSWPPGLPNEDVLARLRDLDLSRDPA